MLIIDEIQKLRIAFVNERADKLYQYEEAYPDVGMGVSMHSCRLDALKQLKTSNIIPDYWEYP